MKPSTPCLNNLKDSSPKKESVLLLPLSLDHKKILLVKRLDVPLFVLPGGGIDRGELAEEAAIRETLEESSCLFKIERKACTLTPCSFLTLKTHIFIGTWVKGIPQPTNETAEGSFFPLDNLPKNLFFLHEKWIKECLENPYFERPLYEITFFRVCLLFFKHPLLLLKWLFRKKERT